MKKIFKKLTTALTQFCKGSKNSLIRCMISLINNKNYSNKNKYKIKKKNKFK